MPLQTFRLAHLLGEEESISIRSVKLNENTTLAGLLGSDATSIEQSAIACKLPGGEAWKQSPFHIHTPGLGASQPRLGQITGVVSTFSYYEAPGKVRMQAD